MITVYKKVEKSKEIPTGFIETKVEDCDKPFLFCISAQHQVPKSIFGIIRAGAQAARVFTTQENAAGFKVDHMPVSFLGLRFKPDDDYSKSGVELVDKFIYPYLTRDGLDIEVLKSRARMMNFLTYCDGTFTYRQIESRLQEKLLEDGLTESEVDEILSEVKLVAIGTMVETLDLKCQSVKVVDVNDEEIATNTTSKVKAKLDENNDEALIAASRKRPNAGFCLYKGTGNHNLKEYYRNGVLVKAGLAYIVSQFIESSIKGKPFRSVEIMPKLSYYCDHTREHEALMHELDESIDYGDVPRYSEEEAILRHQMDELCTELAQTRSSLERTSESVSRLQESNSQIIDGIRKYSSEMTFYQIMCGAGLWQAPTGVNPYEHPSDRDVRAQAEQVEEEAPELIDSQEPVTDMPKKKK